MKREFPTELVERAVWGMLPKGALGRQMYKKLFVYKDEKHEQEAQKPVKLELEK
jgi:large subunit ribosomal protein L13